PNQSPALPEIVFTLDGAGGRSGDSSRVPPKPPENGGAVEIDQESLQALQEGAALPGSGRPADSDRQMIRAREYPEVAVQPREELQYDFVRGEPFHVITDSESLFEGGEAGRHPSTDRPARTIGSDQELKPVRAIALVPQLPAAGTGADSRHPDAPDLDPALLGSRPQEPIQIPSTEDAQPLREAPHRFPSGGRENSGLEATTLREEIPPEKGTGIDAALRNSPPARLLPIRAGLVEDDPSAPRTQDLRRAGSRGSPADDRDIH